MSRTGNCYIEAEEYFRSLLFRFLSAASGIPNLFPATHNFFTGVVDPFFLNPVTRLIFRARSFASFPGSYPLHQNEVHAFLLVLQGYSRPIQGASSSPNFGQSSRTALLLPVILRHGSTAFQQI
ncbi:MAG TPA: hypothetical protein VLY83_02490 [Methanoregula sp.]|nr:hypothetical protein [Methanoregula sp.]